MGQEFTLMPVVILVMKQKWMVTWTLNGIANLAGIEAKVGRKTEIERKIVVIGMIGIGKGIVIETGMTEETAANETGRSFVAVMTERDEAVIMIEIGGTGISLHPLLTIVLLLVLLVTGEGPAQDLLRTTVEAI
jgi:hypothetical protein